MNKAIHRLAKKMCTVLDFHKGDNIAIVDLAGQTVIADCFVVVHGATLQQVRAMADYLQEDMQSMEIRPSRIDGYSEGCWIVLDYGDIIVHLFRKEEREYYNLERLWENGGNITYFLNESLNS